MDGSCTPTTKTELLEASSVRASVRTGQQPSWRGNKISKLPWALCPFEQVTWKAVNKTQLVRCVGVELSGTKGFLWWECCVDIIVLIMLSHIPGFRGFHQPHRQAAFRSGSRGNSSHCLTKKKAVHLNLSSYETGDWMTVPCWVQNRFCLWQHLRVGS